MEASPHIDHNLETISIPSFPKEGLNAPMVVTKKDGTQIGVLVSIEDYQEIKELKDEKEKNEQTPIEKLIEVVEKANEGAVYSKVDEEDYYKQYQ